MSEADEKTVPSEISGLENEFMEYPSLIYDGPFSDHVVNRTSDYLKYKGQITGKMALRAAEEYLGKDGAQGLNVTDEGGGTIETYILDFDEDIYGLDMRVTFVEKIRDEIRFDSLEALRQQLEKDKELWKQSSVY